MLAGELEAPLGADPVAEGSTGLVTSAGNAEAVQAMVRIIVRLGGILREDEDSQAKSAPHFWSIARPIALEVKVPLLFSEVVW